MVFPLWDVLRDQPIPHSAVLHVVLYIMLYACMLYSRWAAGLMVVCHVGQLYTYLRRWQFWTIVWENTNSVHFRAVWKNTTHVQGIRCSPKGSHLIPWTSVVFSNTALKWTPFAYLITMVSTDRRTGNSTHSFSIAAVILPGYAGSQGHRRVNIDKVKVMTWRPYYVAVYHCAGLWGASLSLWRGCREGTWAGAWTVSWRGP